MPRQKNNSKKITEDVLTVLDPQVEFRKFYAWAESVVSAIQQLDDDVLKLTTAKIAALGELADLTTEMQNIRQQISEMRKDLNRLQNRPMVESLSHR